MYKALDVAKYIILTRKENGLGTTNLKLQKILYFIQCYYIDFFDSPCFQEDFIAWAYGPAIPGVYYEFCSWGAHAIHLFDETMPRIQRKDQEIMDYIILQCDKYTARELVMICQQQSAWKNVYDQTRENVMEKKNLFSFFPKREEEMSNKTQMQLI